MMHYSIIAHVTTRSGPLLSTMLRLGFIGGVHICSTHSDPSIWQDDRVPVGYVTRTILSSEGSRISTYGVDMALLARRGIHPSVVIIDQDIYEDPMFRLCMVPSARTVGAHLVVCPLSMYWAYPDRIGAEVEWVANGHTFAVSTRLCHDLSLVTP